MVPPATPSSLAPPGALGRGLAWDPRHGHAQGHGHGGSARKHRCRRPHSQRRSTRPKGGERASVMERELAARDRVGVQDFVLLEDFRSEPAFVDNLRRRFREDLIYTYIGQVLVSVNPYKPLPIYTSEAVKQYRGLHFYEAAPHIFAIADTAYRSLTDENRPQCILISGESGSGKTEASKKVLEFVAEASGHTSTVDNVKDKLLQSNPLLEAFGNAKTNRNDNSSRFGKYMDIAFDFQGVPVGGHILNYLLEKSRVVHQAAGERNFHVFYQLLAGADDALLARLQLRRSLDTYFYCTHGARAGAGLPEHEDATQWAQVRRAMEVVELGAEEQEALLAIVAAVLHLGNVGFTEEEGVAQVLKPEAAEAAARLLGCEVPLLGAALQHRTIEVRGETVTSPLGRDTAIYARDALAKAVYDRLFSWLVARVNASLQGPAAARQNQMGILDIYGFEIFTRNSFEQFCINFCNEKLQQLFIELTLKSEQEEYLREGIEWEPVEYFNNKVICDLIEEKHKGIISLMDEECLRPGDPTDKSFLSKMNANLSNHPHYISHQKADTKTQKIMGRDEFQLKHYAGDVTYNVQGFLDKNNDLLFRDLRHAMSETTNPIIKAVFPASDVVTKRRPDTAATQFKNSLNKLMDILMGKEPSYIRCIKPNDSKSSGIFDEKVVSHQVKYLGLMENLRVRRAGFAFRRPYELFLRRYKCLCPATWPHFNGDAKEGVQTLVNHLNYQRDDFRMGKTKIFIRFPKTLFETEDAFQVKKHQIAAIIQSRWKGRQQRLKFLKMKEAVTTINKYVRRFLAKRDAERRRKAAQVIRRFIEGFITRNGPETPINKEFIEIAKAQYLIRLSKDLPKSVLDNRWPPCPISCKEASEHLRKFHKLWLAKKYRDNLKPQDKKQFEMKILAESLFKDKKKSYAKSVPRRFATDRLKEENKSQRQSFELNQLQSNEKILYSASVTKFDRHGYKPRERVLFLTNRTLYLLEGKTSKLKHNLPLDTVHEVVVTTESDNLVLIRIPPDLKKDKGDLILEVDNLIEAITTLIDITKKPQTVKVMDASSISHNYIGGKQGQIEITTGDQPLITKSKGGHLLVVASR